jgi:hypothetical protein
MEDLVAGGRIVAFILLVIAVEGVVLFAYRLRTGKGLSPAAIIFMLLPGACLLLALRAALTGGSPTAIVGWLAAALIAHLADLWTRQAK